MNKFLAYKNNNEWKDLVMRPSVLKQYQNCKLAPKKLTSTLDAS